MTTHCPQESFQVGLSRQQTCI